MLRGWALLVATAAAGSLGAVACTIVPSTAAAARPALVAVEAAPSLVAHRADWPSAPATRASVDLVLRPGTGAQGRRVVVRWLRRARITSRPIGAAVHATSSTGVLGRLLHVRFEDHRVGGVTVYGATSPPRVPAAIADRVATILGLSDAPVATGNLALATGATTPGTVGASASATSSAGSSPRACPAAAHLADVQPGAATLAKIGDHYGLGALRAQGDEGAGVTIAAFELAPVSRRAVAIYDRCFGLDPSKVGVVKVGTGGTPGAGTMEADVDVEQLQTQAPEAHVVVYQGPNSMVGFYDTLAAIVNADAAQVVSITWGMCEQMDTAAIPALHALFAKAARQGQTVLAASGDTGSEGCLAQDGSTALSVQYPSSDPFVTAVGGTTMGNGATDTVWNACASAGSIACAAYGSPGDATSSGAGGGGVSRYFHREPPFQDGVGRFSGRAVPDVSADAGPSVVYAGGQWTVGAGTSLSAPLVAGIVADVVPTYATPIGDLAPKLYALHQAEGYGTALLPVQSGNNDFSDSYGHRAYRAGQVPAYNRAAGLGTPLAGGFVGPKVVALSRATGVAGDTVTIEGRHLLDTTVRFGDTPATILSARATALRVVVPPGSETTSVTVSNPIGSAGPVAFSYLSPPPASP